MTASYDYWQRTLAGERIGMNEDKPEPGFYRYRASSNDLWLPLSIFYRGDELFIVSAGQRLEGETGLQAWVSAARHPIDEPRFRAWMENCKDPQETQKSRKFSTLSESKTYTVTDRKAALTHFAEMAIPPADFDKPIIEITRRMDKENCLVPGTHIHREERQAS